MAPTVLYIVRHGETDYNRTLRVQGQGVDSTLNLRGLRQAHALAERFRRVPLDAIYTSTLTRARQTGGVVATFHPRAFRGMHAGFDEMNFGFLEGRPHDATVRRVLEHYWTAWKAGRFEEPVPGGESILQVAARAEAALQEVIMRHTGGRILIVTHGRLMRVLLTHILPGYTLADMHRMPHANTGVYKLLYREGAFSACYLNCTRHLAAEALVS